ncbi:pathogenesis-related protein PR-1 type-like [Amaranthus tricolor]|uniref:pathogenesis-related protein PR-1 type-like n=1 Tax=Amaranthus tricolor TaxID=29722 RepID=UPI00258E7B43|nr:pathogenesis-related protein PR-1 type-like [Amaranthus tricolor]
MKTLLSIVILQTTTLFFVQLSVAQNSAKDYLAAHNAARAAVGVPPLTWDERIAAYAQKYAKERAADCKLVHSNADNYGENLAEGYASYGPLSGVDGVELWINEKLSYDYGTNSCTNGEQCGHYTQIVWRDSKRLGCARVLCQNGGAFVTCNYYPPGNYIGERPY